MPDFDQIHNNPGKAGVTAALVSIYRMPVDPIPSEMKDLLALLDDSEHAQGETQ